MSAVNVGGHQGSTGGSNRPSRQSGHCQKHFRDHRAPACRSASVGTGPCLARSGTAGQARVGRAQGFGKAPAQLKIGASIDLGGPLRAMPDFPWAARGNGRSVCRTGLHVDRTPRCPADVRPAQPRQTASTQAKIGPKSRPASWAHGSQFFDKSFWRATADSDEHYVFARAL